MRARALLVLTAAACGPVGGADDGPVGVAPSPVVEAPAAYYVVLPAPPAAALVPPGSDPGAPTVASRVRRHLADLAVARDTMRPQLLAEGATVVAELSRVANAFHVMMTPTAARRVAALPGVERVEPVPLFERSLASALPVVGAPVSWGVPFTGQGIRLGIIDSGIDYLHASFGGSGDPADYAANDRATIEPGTFPTLRVAGGWDFAGDAYNPSGSNAFPSPDPDPLDCGGGHGTHVAGIAGGGGVLASGAPYGGPYDQSFVPSAFRVAPGVAPEATLYAIKIFGCNGSTQLFASGLEWAADPDQDGDLSDRLDVVNASLGTSYGLASPFTDAAVENLASLGTLVVAAAGNEGATFFALSSPARVPAVLSVAASVDSGLVNLEVTAPPAVAGTFAAAEASFSPSLAATGTLSGELVAADPVLACGPITNDLTGKIAFVERGTCPFVQKFAQAEAAGALAVVLANNDFAEPPFVMQGSGASGIPGVMIGAADGQALSAATGVVVTLTGEPYDGDGAELMAGLSSRGPSTDVALKPEIAAPGLQIGSVAVGTGSQPSNKSGTSMAAPFVAGAAALVRQAFPELGPEAIKAALMNSARPIGNATGAIYPVTMQGTGRLDVAAAVAQTITIADADAPAAVGVSFGAFVVSEPVEVSRTVRVTNHGAQATSLTLATEQIHPLPGVTVTASPAALDLGPGEEALATLTLAVDPDSLGDPGLDPVTPAVQFDLPRHALGEADGALVVGGDAAARLPFYAVVRAAGAQRLGAGTSCSDTQVVALEGASAHPRPVVSAFTLGLEHPTNALVPPHLDIRAIGAASNAASETFDETTLFFAVVVEGAWTTAAVAGLPLVGVEIDADGDGLEEFLIVPEPLGHDPPFADVLAATTYDVRTCNGFNLDQCEAVERKRYLNALPADVAPTHPFFNGALVLPVYAADLGLEEGAAELSYRGVTRTLTGTAERTEWARFDAEAPAVDTTAGGIRDGIPFFEEAVAFRGTGSMLVVHHANVAGQHWEVVDVDALGGVPLDLAITGPEAVPLGHGFTATIAVKNDGGAALGGVAVEVSAEGGVIEAVTAPGGACEGAICTFDSLSAGATATVDVVITAAGPVTIGAAVTTPEGCSDTRLLEVALTADPEVPAARLVASGGCGCRVAAPPVPNGWWLSAVAALGLWRRRRRR